MINQNPKISIIIRTLNEAAFLKPLLSSIREQSYENKETIIVDSGSFDGTIEIAKKYGDKLVAINQEDFTFGFAINYGIKHATGDYICIVSAHTLPKSDQWLKALLDGFSHPELNGQIAMTYGKQLGDKYSNFGEVRDYIRQYQYSDKEIIQEKPNYFCNNANSMIRKDLWVDHPFDEALTGLEDIEWSKYWMDRGYRIIYKPDAEIFHIHRETPDQIKRRFWRETIAARSIGILPAHKLFLQVLAQGILAASDLVNAFNNRLSEKWTEILSFRKNKAAGMLKALSHEKYDLRDYSAHYAPFDYKVIEFQKQNIAKETVYPIEPTRPNDVLIQVHYVGVCETDFEVLRGDLNFYKSGWAQYPIIPGHEFSGKVVRVGSKVKQFKLGDSVVGQCILSCGICEHCLSGRETACLKRKEVGVLNYNGAYAEYVTLSARFVHKIPISLPMISASSIEPLAVVLKGMRRAGLTNVSLSDRNKILVIGAGPIGHFAARVGCYWDHHVMVLDKNKKRLDYLSDIPVETTEDVTDFQLFSHIIECTGDARIGQMIIEKSATASIILLLGLPYAKQLIDMEEIVSSDKNIIGSVGSHGDDFRDAISMAQHINISRFDDSIYAFENWREAWETHKTKRELKVKLEVAKDIT